MSSEVFPTLPGLDVAVERSPSYATEVHESVSGKEVRVSWRTLPRISYKIRINGARTGTDAPSPYAAMDEMAVLIYFLDLHKGSFESFLYPDPYTGSNVRVRLVEDSLRMVQVVSGWWRIDSLELVSVL
jgi:hypothetical protein